MDAGNRRIMCRAHECCISACGKIIFIVSEFHFFFFKEQKGYRIKQSCCFLGMALLT